MCRITTNESGTMLETAVQSLLNEEFYSIFECIEQEDENALFVIEDLIMLAAIRTSTLVNQEQFSTAIGNVFLLFYCESLRRKGVITYPEQRNCFESNNNYCRLETLPLLPSSIQ
jgi:hypothetical protein